MMNERIKELADQCWNNFDLFGVEIKTPDAFAEKFAELMVIEFTETVKQTAILVAQTAYNDGESKADVDRRVAGALRVLDVLRERFGVE